MINEYLNNLVVSPVTLLILAIISAQIYIPPPLIIQIYDQMTIKHWYGAIIHALMVELSRVSIKLIHPVGRAIRRAYPDNANFTTDGYEIKLLKYAYS